MYDRRNIGINIIVIRLEKNIKQIELANMVGISASYLCDIEKGRILPSIKKLLLIADALNIEPDMLFK